MGLWVRVCLVFLSILISFSFERGTYKERESNSASCQGEGKQLCMGWRGLASSLARNLTNLRENQEGPKHDQEIDCSPLSLDLCDLHKEKKIIVNIAKSRGQKSTQTPHQARRLLPSKPCIQACKHVPRPKQWGLCGRLDKGSYNL